MACAPDTIPASNLLSAATISLALCLAYNAFPTFRKPQIDQIEHNLSSAKETFNDARTLETDPRFSSCEKDDFRRVSSAFTRIDLHVQQFRRFLDSYDNFASYVFLIFSAVNIICILLFSVLEISFLRSTSFFIVLGLLSPIIAQIFVEFIFSFYIQPMKRSAFQYLEDAEYYLSRVRG